MGRMNGFTCINKQEAKNKSETEHILGYFSDADGEILLFLLLIINLYWNKNMRNLTC
jgi:hypothetical protein